MKRRAWKWALISALMALSVSGCMGWGGYPHAKNVHESQLIGTWRARDCDITLTLNRDGSASVTGMPTEMDLDGKVTQRVGGDGTWEIYKSGAEQELDVTIGDEGTPFDLYRDKGRLVMGLTVGDPDDMNVCILTRRSKTAANAPSCTAVMSPHGRATCCGALITCWTGGDSEGHRASGSRPVAASRDQRVTRAARWRLGTAW